MALELSRGRLMTLLETPASGKAGRGPRGLGLLMRRIVGLIDLDATLRLTAERHPYGVLALSAGAGGLAYLVVPRLASGLIIPLLLSEGRLLIHEMLLGWLRAGGTGHGPAGAA